MVFYIYFIVAMFYYVIFFLTDQAIFPDLKQILETPSPHNYRRETAT